VDCNNMNKNKTRLTILIASLFTATVLVASAAPVAAQGVSAMTTEFSAQQQQQNKEKKGGGQMNRGPARTQAPSGRAPRTQGTTRQKGPATSGPKVGKPKGTGPKVTGPKVTGPKVGGPRVAGPKPARVFTPRGPNSRSVVFHGRLRGYPARGAGYAMIGGRNYSVWRSGYRVRYHGGWRTFVALSALTAVLIGTTEFYPYAYLSAPEPYCDGLTEDGCQLVWQDVETIEGDIVPQCVAYCPWQ
jgi:hypothetical protein